MTHDTWHMAHDTWHMAHGAWCMAHGTWHMTHGTWHKMSHKGGTQRCYLVLTAPHTGLCTGCTQVCAHTLALPVHTLGSAHALAWGACGTPMAGLATCMPTQQAPAALLAAWQVCVAAAWDWRR